jgi:hypothetical protein
VVIILYAEAAPKDQLRGEGQAEQLEKDYPGFRSSSWRATKQTLRDLRRSGKSVRGGQA